MNLREMQRVTMPSLPSQGDNLVSLISKATNALKELFNRDGDKEQRIRKLEDLLQRGTGKFSLVKYFGEDWRIVDLQDGTGNLYVQHTPDNGITWNTSHTFTP